MSKFNFKDLEETLAELNRLGPFKASIITAESGFVIASAITKGTDEDIIAATGPAIHSTVTQVNNQIKLGKAQDIIVIAEKGALVIKTITIENGGEYILAIISPLKANWYGNEIANTIEKIKNILTYFNME